MKRYIIRYLIIFTLLAGGLITVCAIHEYKQKNGYVDKNGYTHTRAGVTNEINLTSTPAVKDGVVLVPTNIEEAFHKTIDDGVSGYEFLSYILPFVTKTQATVLFEFSDETGVYITSANPSSAIYGEIENNQIAYDIGYINISGMNMTYEGAPDYASKDSRELAKLIPEEYQTDGLYVRVSDSDAYICVTTTDGVPADVADEIYNIVKGNIHDLPLIVLINDAYKYEYNDVMVTHNVLENDEVGVQ